MELILWRHAEAEDGADDMRRRLTGKGDKQADKMAAFLRPLLPKETRILASPAVRAEQTVKTLGLDFITEPAIAPAAPARALLQAANWPKGSGCVLLVGHQPSLGAAAALAMTGTATYWNIKKGAVWWFGQRERDGETETLLRLAMAPEFL
ncbi:MAG: histidine phosphatase family protein [Gallionellaceae bacterium]|nr:histidine phosphatase family protein [Gallionellaceae bacterium]